MLDMKNGFISSASSHVTGNTDFQMLNRNVLPEMGHNLGFCMANHLILIDEEFAYPYDHLTSHGHLDFQGLTSNYDTLAPQSEEDELLSQKTSKNGSSKRIKTASSQEQSHLQPEDTPKLPLRTRGSQKLSDKITVLQKLVSPYGKTNTAAVLEEACFHIKLLQQQIATLSDSCNPNPETRLQENEERVLDLRSRGLCLVSASFCRKVTMAEDRTDFLQKIKIPRKF